jgi:flagellar basal body P-ring formation protein FlgA
MAGARKYSAILALTLAIAAGAGPLWAAETVLVPSKVIYPGEKLSADALKEVTLAEGKLPPQNVAIALGDLEGKVAKRTLLPGRYVQQNAVREAYVVEKGVPVEMIFVSGSLQISASAVTLDAGSAGDLVKIRNVDSGKIVSGVVMADGSIRVSAE